MEFTLEQLRSLCVIFILYKYLQLLALANDCLQGLQLRIFDQVCLSRMPTLDSWDMRTQSSSRLKVSHGLNLTLLFQDGAQGRRRCATLQNQRVERPHLKVTISSNTNRLNFGSPHLIRGHLGDVLVFWLALQNDQQQAPSPPDFLRSLDLPTHGQLPVNNLLTLFTSRHDCRWEARNCRALGVPERLTTFLIPVSRSTS